jgi:hypothetical protein
VTDNAMISPAEALAIADQLAPFVRKAEGLLKLARYAASCGNVIQEARRASDLAAASVAWHGSNAEDIRRQAAEAAKATIEDAHARAREMIDRATAAAEVIRKSIADLEATEREAISRKDSVMPRALLAFIHLPPEHQEQVLGRVVACTDGWSHHLAAATRASLEQIRRVLGEEIVPVSEDR